MLMASGLKSKEGALFVWILAGVSLLLAFGGFLAILVKTWFGDSEFSYGILIPAIVALLIWRRRDRLQNQEKSMWLPGLGVAAAGCGVQILGSMSGSLLLSGIAFTA